MKSFGKPAIATGIVACVVAVAVWYVLDNKRLRQPSMMDIFITITDDKSSVGGYPDQTWKSSIEQQAAASPRPNGS